MPGASHHGELAPLASHHSLHLSGSGREGIVPVNHILLETSVCLAVPQRGCLSSFFCQTLARGRALAAPWGSPGGMGLIAPLPWKMLTPPMPFPLGFCGREGSHWHPSPTSTVWVSQAVLMNSH